MTRGGSLGRARKPHAPAQGQGAAPRAGPGGQLGSTERAVLEQVDESFDEPLLVQIAHDAAALHEADRPVSSLTTTASASVCSVMPRAARWRVPKRSR